MLKVTIELIPGGFSKMSETIGSMRNSNMSNLADVSDRRSDGEREPVDWLSGAKRRLHGVGARTMSERLGAAGQGLRGNPEGGFRRTLTTPGRLCPHEPVTGANNGKAQQCPKLENQKSKAHDGGHALALRCH